MPNNLKKERQTLREDVGGGVGKCGSGNLKTETNTKINKTSKYKKKTR
jgi:hypothetical protein